MSRPAVAGIAMPLPPQGVYCIDWAMEERWGTAKLEGIEEIEERNGETHVVVPLEGSGSDEVSKGHARSSGGFHVYSRHLGDEAVDCFGLYDLCEEWYDVALVNNEVAGGRQGVEESSEVLCCGGRIEVGSWRGRYLLGRRRGLCPAPGSKQAPTR